MKRLLVTVCVASVLGTVACGGCDDPVSNNGANNNLDGGTADTGVADGGDNNANNGTDGGGNDANSGVDGGSNNGMPDMASCLVDEQCGGVCCDDGQECVDDICLAACAGQRCGATNELCCEGADVCLGEACVTPGSDCTFTEDCGVDEICDPTLQKCVPRDQVEVCEFIPPVGNFAPEIGCSWQPPAGDQSDRVVVTPVVGNVTDDNGDGLTNTDDIPDIIFLSRTAGCCNKAGTLRVVSGECNPDGTMNTIASLDSEPMVNDGAPALGDLDGDGVPEIVAISYTGNLNPNNGRGTPQGVVAWKRVTDDGTQWERFWRNDTYPTNGIHTNGGATIAIADLNADGNPEVVVGNVALNGQDGTLLWDGYVDVGPDAGIGNNAFLGPSSSIGDVNLDGNLEVAAGNTLYAHDGTELWTFMYNTENSPCGGGLPCDGYTAMANFDADDEGEIVIVRRGEVFILNHDGTLLWQFPILKDDCANNESGPPTVADFDGDGMPEIGTAAADFYTVLDMECDADPVPMKCRQRGILWATPNNDCSSRVTASSVFDFEGDGKAEMVYADERNFRIFDGTTGVVLFDDDTHSSNTRIEMPIVADVDNDGNSEIIVPSDTGQAIKVFQDTADNWVRTRRIWNQHTYHVTNINEDGTVPVGEMPNWLNGRLNNFRQNVQPGGLFDAPNLVVESVDVRGTSCGQTFEVEVTVTVSNDGALGVSAGVPVRITATDGTVSQTLGDFTTMDRLLPGQSETFTVTWEVPADWVANGFTIGAFVDPDMTTNECIESDNELEFDGANVTFAAPELNIVDITADAANCGNTGMATVTFTARNDGAEIVPIDTPIVLTAAWLGQTVEIGTYRLSAPLAMGEEETFTANWNAPQSARGRDVTFTATVDPDREVYDCDEQNSGEVTEECRIVM